jgi:hypothetical protein
MHNVQLVNKSPRKIAEVYVFSPGSQSHGASRGSLEPGASMNVKLKKGNHEILAVSEKIYLNDTTRDVYQASSTIQLVRPLLLIVPTRTTGTGPPEQERTGHHLPAARDAEGAGVSATGSRHAVITARPRPRARCRDSRSPSRAGRVPVGRRRRR